MSDAERITKLEREMERLRSELETVGRTARFPAIRSPRLCITTVDPTTDQYPSLTGIADDRLRAYWIQFLNGSFGANDKPPSPVFTGTERQSVAGAWGYTLGQEYIPDGTLCAAFLDGSARKYGGNAFQWWLMPFPKEDRLFAQLFVKTLSNTPVPVSISEANYAVRDRLGFSVQNGTTGPGISPQRSGYFWLHFECSLSYRTNGTEHPQVRFTWRRNPLTENAVLVQADAYATLNTPIGSLFDFQSRFVLSTRTPLTAGDLIWVDADVSGVEAGPLKMLYAHVLIERQ